ncbi:type II toxin-antitoxin system death-on-curing family toxin [Candidatus Poriferisodalis sp.]|uniref:type II toxin-antitoxin system death-on-curing family toxin n=1 Tax=Candidatus Poriferisodalis sp. TaxID=3101277 RepID=UPI003B01FF05
MTRYLGLAEYLWLAEQVTGIEAEKLSRLARIELADSALHAPQAVFAGTEFYPDVVDKASVLCWRLARNHPLPDGNKRAAWAALSVFIELNGGRWDPDPPDVDDSERMMLGVASGAVDEDSLAAWLRGHVRFD